MNGASDMLVHNQRATRSGSRISRRVYIHGFRLSIRQHKLNRGFKLTRGHPTGDVRSATWATSSLYLCYHTHSDMDDDPRTCMTDGLLYMQKHFLFPLYGFSKSNITAWFIPSCHYKGRTHAPCLSPHVDSRCRGHAKGEISKPSPANELRKVGKIAGRARILDFRWQSG